MNKSLEYIDAIDGVWKTPIQEEIITFFPDFQPANEQESHTFK